MSTASAWPSSARAGTLYAISNVCPHQNGPLGEGVVRDGYLECPWHGYQFDPCTGLGPPGFADSVPTFELVTKGDQTYLRVRLRAPILASSTGSRSIGDPPMKLLRTAS